MTNKKYYKVVYKNKYNVLRAYNRSFEYKPKTWHDKSETVNKTAFFVFTTLKAAEEFDSGEETKEIWECQIVNPHEYESILKRYILSYKTDAVFCDKVKLTNRIPKSTAFPQIELENGMIFRIKGKKQYLQYLTDVPTESIGLHYLGGKSHGLLYHSIPDWENVGDILYGYCNGDLVYCPGYKARVTVDIIKPTPKASKSVGKVKK